MKKTFFVVIGFVIFCVGLLFVLPTWMKKEMEVSPVVVSDSLTKEVVAYGNTVWVDSLPSKWVGTTPMPTTSRLYEREELMTEIIKLRKELLVAIQNKKCTCGEIKDGPRTQPYWIIPMPDETLPTEIDTASMKILLHSYGN